MGDLTNYKHSLAKLCPAAGYSQSAYNEHILLRLSHSFTNSVNSMLENCPSSLVPQHSLRSHQTP